MRDVKWLDRFINGFRTTAQSGRFPDALANIQIYQSAKLFEIHKYLIRRAILQQESSQSKTVLSLTQLGSHFLTSSFFATRPCTAQGSSTPNAGHQVSTCFNMSITEVGIPGHPMSIEMQAASQPEKPPELEGTVSLGPWGMNQRFQDCEI